MPVEEELELLTAACDLWREFRRLTLQVGRLLEKPDPESLLAVLQERAACLAAIDRLGPAWRDLPPRAPELQALLTAVCQADAANQERLQAWQAERQAQLNALLAGRRALQGYAGGAQGAFLDSSR